MEEKEAIPRRFRATVALEPGGPRPFQLKLTVPRLCIQLQRMQNKPQNMQ